MRPAGQLVTLIGAPGLLLPHGERSSITVYKIQSYGVLVLFIYSPVFAIAVREDIAIECHGVCSIPDACHAAIAIVVQGNVHVGMDFRTRDLELHENVTVFFLSYLCPAHRALARLAA